MLDITTVSKDFFNNLEDDRRHKTATKMYTNLHTPESIIIGVPKNKNCGIVDFRNILTEQILYIYNNQKTILLMSEYDDAPIAVKSFIPVK